MDMEIHDFTLYDSCALCILVLERPYVTVVYEKGFYICNVFWIGLDGCYFAPCRYRIESWLRPRNLLSLNLATQTYNETCGLIGVKYFVIRIIQVLDVILHHTSLRPSIPLKNI